MKLILSLVLYIAFSASCFGQNDDIYKGGIQNFEKSISRQIMYPVMDRENGIEGNVIVRFRTYDGKSIDSIEVINSVSHNIDREVIRNIKTTTGNWNLVAGESYLIQFVFRVEQGNRIPLEKDKEQRDGALIKFNHTEALKLMEKIKKYDPYDFDNLEMLNLTFKKLLELEKLSYLNYYRNQIQTLNLISIINITESVSKY